MDTKHQKSQKSKKPKEPNSSRPLKEGQDFYFNEKGLMVLTASYLLERGYCCENGCFHCPYKSKKENENEKKEG